MGGNSLFSRSIACRKFNLQMTNVPSTATTESFSYLMNVILSTVCCLLALTVVCLACCTASHISVWESVFDTLFYYMSDEIGSFSRTFLRRSFCCSHFLFQLALSKAKLHSLTKILSIFLFFLSFFVSLSLFLCTLDLCTALLGGL